jgi:hypothetical protein
MEIWNRIAFFGFGGIDAYSSSPSLLRLPLKGKESDPFSSKKYQTNDRIGVRFSS